jgi:hypothetical protein
MTMLAPVLGSSCTPGCATAAARAGRSEAAIMRHNALQRVVRPPIVLTAPQAADFASRLLAVIDEL